MDISKYLDNQKSNLCSYFQNQANSYILGRGIIEADDETLSQLEQELFRCHKTDKQTCE